MKKVSCGKRTQSLVQSMNWLFEVASDFMVSYSHLDSHRYAELLRRFFLVVTSFRLLSPLSLRVLLWFGCFAAERKTLDIKLNREASSAERSLAVYQRKRVSRPASILGCPNLVDFISNTALSFLEINKQRMRLKSEERKVNEACLVPPVCVWTQFCMGVD